MKKETLKSYMEKSAMSGLADSDRKMENRMVGMGRAHKKILGRKPNPNDVKQFVEEMDKKGRSIVTSENREEFMAKKLKLDQTPPEDEQEMKYVVKYFDETGKPTGSERTFDSEDKAVQHAKKGNMIDKVGGKYVVSKVRG